MRQEVRHAFGASRGACKCRKFPSLFLIFPSMYCYSERYLWGLGKKKQSSKKEQEKTCLPESALPS